MAYQLIQHINPAAPDRNRVLAKLDKGGTNWYIRIRENGRYRARSLGTPDLAEARRIATHSPPDFSPSHSISVQRALMQFLESRQQLLDAPHAAHEDEPSPIRKNTFLTYRARINTLLAFFKHLSKADYRGEPIPLARITVLDLGRYQQWRQKRSINKKLALSTLRHEAVQINAIWKWFYEQGMIPRQVALDLKKYKKPKSMIGSRRVNRLFTREEYIKMKRVLAALSKSSDKKQAYTWSLFGLWLTWLEDTFTRPHESLMLRFSDVNSYKENATHSSVSFYTDSETKTGRRFVYATSSVKSKLIEFYRKFGVDVSEDDYMFCLSTKTPPSRSWLSDRWKELMGLCNFKLQPRELTMYSLRHQGINTLLTQGVPPVKVADLAGHSLQIQQSIYKQLSLEGDKTVLRDPRRTRYMPQQEQVNEFLESAFLWERDEDGNPDFD